MRNIYKNEQNGRSMVEMLGVLAIIGVLSVGGIAGYSKAMTKFKINKSMDQISMLVANIRTLFSGQRNYSGLNNANAVSFGIIPNEMDGGGGVITNAFAGNVTIGTMSVSADGGEGTTYTGADLPITLINAAANCGCATASCSIQWTYL